MAKWDNMLSMLWMLKSGKKLTAAQMAEALEISVRTVYRYIDALCASGVPIVADSGHDGGYRILEGFQETLLLFRTVELKAIVDASKFAKGAGYPYTEELAAALEKIEYGLNEEQIQDLQRQTSGFDVISAARQPSVVTRLRQLEQAILEGRSLRIVYQKDQEAEAKERVIDPYGLAFRKNEWYLVAYCHRSRESRTFRVDRIVNLSPTGANFAKPENFSALEYFREQSQRERAADGPMVTIRVGGDVDSLNNLCAHWHLQHFLVERTDKEATFLIDAPTMDKYLPVYFMTLGTSIHIREPAELREKIRDMAFQIAQHHEGGRVSSSLTSFVSEPDV